MKVQVMDITPEMAKAFLLRQIKSQRSLSKEHVRRLAKAMTDGRFLETGAPIRVTVEGELLDGQHRLAACVASGVTLHNIVVEVVDAKVMCVVDTDQRGRNVSDVAAALGFRRASPGVISAAFYEHFDFAYAKLTTSTKTDRAEVWGMLSEAEQERAQLLFNAACRGGHTNVGLLAGALRALKYSTKPDVFEFLLSALSNEPGAAPQATVLYNTAQRNKRQQQMYLYPCSAWLVLRLTVAWEQDETLLKVITPQTFEFNMQNLRRRQTQTEGERDRKNRIRGL